MSEVLRCKPNIAEHIALKFADGINVSGEYGNQVLYTLADNRKLYVPPIVAKKIKDLKIGAEERFSLCKRIAPGNRVSWEINRVDPPASEPRIAPPVNSQTATVGPYQNTQHSNGNRQETLTQLGNVLKNGMPGLTSATSGQMTGQIAILPSTTSLSDRSSERRREVRNGDRQTGEVHKRRHPRNRDLLLHPAA